MHTVTDAGRHAALIDAAALRIGADRHEQLSVGCEGGSPVQRRLRSIQRIRQLDAPTKSPGCRRRRVAMQEIAMLETEQRGDRAAAPRLRLALGTAACRPLL